MEGVHQEVAGAVSDTEYRIVEDGNGDFYCEELTGRKWSRVVYMSIASPVGEVHHKLHKSKLYCVARTFSDFGTAKKQLELCVKRFRRDEDEADDDPRKQVKRVIPVDV